MTRVREHFRSLPFEKVKAAKTEQLWNELVRLQCVIALERAFPEPLDGLDVPEWQKQRIRETGF